MKINTETPLITMSGTFYPGRTMYERQACRRIVVVGYIRHRYGVCLWDDWPANSGRTGASQGERRLR
jgi:hypothetical protein